MKIVTGFVLEGKKVSPAFEAISIYQLKLMVLRLSQRPGG